MKKFIFVLLLLVTTISYSNMLSLELSHINSSNEPNYDGMAISLETDIYHFTNSIYLSGDLSVYIIDGDLDPGLHIYLNKDFALGNRWTITIFGGVGGIYINNKDINQHENFNFKEDLGIRLSKEISPVIEVYISGSIWHISNAGMTDRNTGIDGSSVGIGFRYMLN